MAFQRALWHSGLTYQRTCDCCKAVISYNDYALDFRPWYPDGFVYCPRCNSPQRHNEGYAINSPAAVQSQPALPEQQRNPAFCPQCGQAFHENDRFCTNCGTKRQ